MYVACTAVRALTIGMKEGSKCPRLKAVSQFRVSEVGCVGVFSVCAAAGSGRTVPGSRQPADGLGTHECDCRHLEHDTTISS